MKDTKSIRSAIPGLTGVVCAGIAVLVSAIPLDAAAVQDPNAILGFEDTSTWTVNHGMPTSTTVRTQGTAAFEVSPPHRFDRDRDEDDEGELEQMRLLSAPVDSTAKALTGIGEPGASFAVDVLVPPPEHHGHHDHDERWLKLSVRCPSRHLHEVELGRVELRASGGGLYTTVKFPIPKHVAERLAGATYDDLRFELELHTPGTAPGSDLFDNLRVHSPATPPAGPGQSVDLIALLSYSPSQSTPGTATFPVGIVQVPQSFHVKLGNAGTSGRVQLDLGLGGSIFTTCLYDAGAGGTSYTWSSCTGGIIPGDLVAADQATLTILSGDPSAGTTKIRAQLALNPVGDTAGAGIIPPMPTFWGDTPASESQIVTDYFNAVNAADPYKTEERWIQTPVPEFARHSGDGSPHDNLLGPPPPNDPPFDKEGHLNPGGSWDAYWRLAGNLTTDNSNSDNTAHFEANLSGHAVLWGNDVEVVSLQTTIDTNNGEVTQNGQVNQSASGSLHMYLFGQELPGGGSASPQAGFNFTVGTGPQNYDLPSIPIWIFSITIGVSASAGVTATGNLSFAGFNVQMTPQASVGAHLEGDVNLGIASGGVSADIDLLSVSTPMTVDAGWSIDTTPGVCSASLDYELDGQLQLSSLGGEVDLEATFGVCPFCDHQSWTIFSWSGVDLGTKPLFHFAGNNQLFPLPSSLCTTNLDVSIGQLPTTPPPTQGLESVLTGSATRPPFSGSTGEFLAPPDCSILSWQSDNSGDAFSSSTGCTPTVTWGSAGQRTITLTATDQYGETGQATVQVNVLALTGPSVVITSPVSNSSFQFGTDITFLGQEVGGTEPLTYTWTATPHGGGTPITLATESSTSSGQTPATTWYSPPNGTYDVTLSVKDANGQTNQYPATTTVTIYTLQ